MGRIAVILLLLAAGCAASPTDRQTDLAVFAALMTGAFATAPDDPEYNFIDRRALARVAGADGLWLYTQLNTGEEKRVYRQRLSQLTLSAAGDAIIQRTYGLKTPDAFVDAWATPGRLDNLTEEDFEPYFNEGCEQIWRQTAPGAWAGYVDPATCKVFSERRQAEIAIEAEARTDGDIYRQTERGFDADGAQLFGTAPGELIALYRRYGNMETGR